MVRELLDQYIYSVLLVQISERCFMELTFLVSEIHSEREGCMRYAQPRAVSPTRTCNQAMVVSVDALKDPLLEQNQRRLYSVVSCDSVGSWHRHSNPSRENRPSR